MQLLNIAVSHYNSKPHVNTMTDFCQKSTKKPTCTELMLTSRPRSLGNFNVAETSLTDFHRMTITVMRSFSAKHTPTLLNRRNYQYFSNYFFRKKYRQIHHPSAQEDLITGVFIYWD